MAFVASSSAISTKPNPRDRPVLGSVATTALWTAPNDSNIDRRAESVIENAKFPTKTFMFSASLLRDLNFVHSDNRLAGLPQSPLSQAQTRFCFGRPEQPTVADSPQKLFLAVALEACPITVTLRHVVLACIRTLPNFQLRCG
jgi:hypothetical protein